MSTESAVFPWSSRLLSLVGLVLWLVALLAAVCEVLASQAPASPFHWGVLPGPFAQLQTQCFWLGTLLMGLAWMWPRWLGAGGGRVSLWLLVSGAILESGSLLWAAASGMLAVQINDPRGDARLMFYGRALGHALVLLGALSLLPAALRSLRSR